MQVETETKELLLKVCKAIEDNPNKFDMGWWCKSDHGRTCHSDPKMEMELLQDIENSCGTTACIAGWTVHISDPESVANAVKELNKKYSGLELSVRNAPIDETAQQLLDVDHVTASSLFYIRYWPQEFQKMIDEVGEVKAAVARIHHFIETGE